MDSDAELVENNNPTIDLNLVQKAINALLKHEASRPKTNDLLLVDQPVVIWLIIATFKFSEKPKPKPVSIPLKHPIYGPSTEICLITKDPQKTYKEWVKKHEVKRVQKVIGISKLRKKYIPYEAKRNLCDSYDLFLADERVLPLLPKMLGKYFFEKKKQPIPLNISKEASFKKEILKACHCTYMYHRQGICLSIKIGTTEMTSNQLLENLEVAIPVIIDKIPRKWKNIQSLHIKTPESISLPIYNCLPELPIEIDLKDIKKENHGDVIKSEIKINDLDSKDNEDDEDKEYDEDYVDEDEEEEEGDDYMDEDDSENDDVENDDEDDTEDEDEGEKDEDNTDKEEEEEKLVKKRKISKDTVKNSNVITKKKEKNGSLNKKDKNEDANKKEKSSSISSSSKTKITTEAKQGREKVTAERKIANAKGKETRVIAEAKQNNSKKDEKSSKDSQMQVTASNGKKRKKPPKELATDVIRNTKNIKKEEIEVSSFIAEQKKEMMEQTKVDPNESNGNKEAAKFADKKVVDKKVADKKVVDKKVTDKKVTDKKVTDKKVTDKKVTDKKVTDKKVADKKVADKKVVDKKVVDKKVVDKKVADKKVADKKVVGKKNVLEKKKEVTNDASVNNSEKKKVQGNKKNEKGGKKNAFENKKEQEKVISANLPNNKRKRKASEKKK